MTTFSPAVREQTKARIALTGISGSGKTWTALALAHALGDRIGMVDTGRRTARQYAGANGWEFNTREPDGFAPVSLVDILTDAAAEDHDVVIVDTLTHFWSGPDGHLEQVDKHQRGGWNEERPHERLMLDALMSYPGHVIVTLRSKTEYVVDRDENDRAVSRRIGLKPEQRDGIEYDFDLVADLDSSNTLSVTSTRIPELNRAVVASTRGAPFEAFVECIKDWLNAGEPVLDARAIRDFAVAAESTEVLVELGREMDRMHLRNTVVVNENGARTTLRDLIALRFEKLREAQQ